MLMGQTDLGEPVYRVCYFEFTEEAMCYTDVMTYSDICLFTVFSSRSNGLTYKGAVKKQAVKRNPDMCRWIE